MSGPTPGRSRSPRPGRCHGRRRTSEQADTTRVPPTPRSAGACEWARHGQRTRWHWPPGPRGGSAGRRGSALPQRPASRGRAGGEERSKKDRNRNGLPGPVEAGGRARERPAPRARRARDHGRGARLSAERPGWKTRPRIQSPRAWRGRGARDRGPNGESTDTPRAGPRSAAGRAKRGGRTIDAPWSERDPAPRPRRGPGTARARGAPRAATHQPPDATQALGSRGGRERSAAETTVAGSRGTQARALGSESRLHPTRDPEVARVGWSWAGMASGRHLESRGLGARGGGARPRRQRVTTGTSAGARAGLGGGGERAEWRRWAGRET